MAHQTSGRAYTKLIERLNRFPQGAPLSETLYKILNVLFSERDAELVSLLPVKPFTVTKAAAIWKMSQDKARKILDDLASRAILVDIERDGDYVYVLPPPMAGFIEFSLMRTRGDINQELLADLYNQYINIEEEFVRDLFLTGETQLGRVFVQESVIPEVYDLHVLDYEKATEVIRTARHIGISMCYCRHKKQHLGTACDASMDICMTFNSTAASLIRHGHSRAVDDVECLDLLDKAYSENLVQFGENNREGVNFICNCCPCCCEAMIAARDFGFMTPVHTTHFIAGLNHDECSGCGMCSDVCPVGAFSTENDCLEIDRGLCLGCGVCVRVCPSGAVTLFRREKQVIPPLNTAHRSVVMAIERGKLQNLIFDNHVMMSHRLFGSLLGVILKLPGIRKVMAGEQVKSRYLETVIKRMEI